ncbi:hypothetical protein ACFSQ3_10345 [Sphingobacterium corticis]|uniref:Uncharacterized protein n=1 Tax=Sphingobacterium corticis TaxID=1812823 RepID=A0ABW5NMS5_9SPHI
MEQIKEKLLQIETSVDALVRDLVKIAPMIHESNQDTTELNQNLVKGLNKLQELILEREIQQEKLLNALEPYFLTIEQYQKVGTNIEQIVDTAVSKLNSTQSSLLQSVGSIPKETLLVKKHTLDYKSLPLILIFSLMATAISFGLGQFWEQKKQLVEKRSYEIRYRLMALEMPEFVSGVDSLFSENSERFEEVVMKREEEQRLLHSIERKRLDIKNLDNK